jgi:inner membrane protein
MQAPTHIIGGAVFAGTMCSFFNVNIFENWQYATVCAIFSIIPDIDTTKSAIGTICYPVAWILNRKAGHRTITHSLMFFVFIWTIFKLMLYFGILHDTNIKLIALFALLSHLILDMMTVSGIPLLYPFFRNPCVIPGNPAYRFETGKWRSEIIICGVCGILCITMQPLFANGFWTSYNRAFATVQHVDRENQNTEFYVICEYSYIQNAQQYTGEAIVLESNENQLVLFDRQKVFTLSSDNSQTKIVHTKPRISNIEKRFVEMHFFNVTLDSVHHLLTGRLASGLIQSNYNVHYIEDAITYYTNFIKFANRYDFRLFAGQDSVRSLIRNNIAKLEASITQHRIRFNEEHKRWKQHHQTIYNIEDSLKNRNITNYERNRLQKELLKLKNRTFEEPVYVPPMSQIAELESQRKTVSERFLLFSGHVTIYQFGYTQLEQQAIIPNFDINKSSLFAKL